MAKQQRKDPNAAALGRKRWEGIPKAKRREAARRAIAARWARYREKAKGKSANPEST